MTAQEYEIIYSMHFLAGQKGSDIAGVIGRHATSVNNILRWMRAVRNKDSGTARDFMDRGIIGAEVACPWAEKRLGIKIPEPEKQEPVVPVTEQETPQEEPKADPQVGPQEPAPNDMTGKFIMRVLSNQTAQTELLRCLLDTVKQYGPAILSDMQRLATTHKRMADSVDKMEAAILKMEEALHDTGKELSADLKDNINANADIIRQELNTIKNNTRKRGL